MERTDTPTRGLIRELIGASALACALCLWLPALSPAAETGEGDSLSGTVMKAALHPAPLAGAEVCAEALESVVAVCVSTNSNGEYEIDGLAPGGYDVAFTASGFLSQYYKEASSQTGATVVTVSASEQTTGIAATLEESDPGEPQSTLAPLLSTSEEHIVGSTLHCSEGEWSNNPIKLEYAWLRGGNLIAGQSEPTYTVEPADEGATITCRVSASNHSGEGSAPSNGIAIVAKPHNSSAPSLTGNDIAKSTLHCSEGEWSNAPSEFTYAWFRDGSAIAGQSASSYEVQPADEGEIITCRVTATNEAGSAGATSNPITIAGRPGERGAPVLSGTPGLGGTLHCSEGEWSNAPTKFAYEWRRGIETIAGQTAGTYEVRAADEGATITCAVTAENEAGSQSARSNGLTIDVKPASSQAPVLSASATTVGGTLHCSEGTWSGSPRTFAYAWLRNGSPIAGASASTYTIQGADEGAQLSCEVTAADDSGAATATSNSIAIAKASHPGTTTQTVTTVVVQPVSTPLAVATASVSSSVKVKGALVTLTLSCPGPGVCKGTVTLSVHVKETRTIKHHRVKHTRTLVLAQSAFTVGARASKQFQLKLSATAQRLVAGAGRRGLTVSAGGSGVHASTLVLKR